MFSLTQDSEQNAPPPPPDHDAEVKEQAVDRTSVDKKPWTKPTIIVMDGMEFFKGGPQPDTANEDAVYFILSG